MKEELRARLAGPKADLNVARRRCDIKKYEYYAMEAKVLSLEAEVEQAELEMIRKGEELAEANAGVRVCREDFGTSFIEEQDQLPEGCVDYQSDLECSSNAEVVVDATSDDEGGDDTEDSEGNEFGYAEGDVAIDDEEYGIEPQRQHLRRRG